MNESLPIIDVDYNTWKQMKVFLAGRVYFIKSKTNYDLVLVDLQRRFITVTHLRGAKKLEKVHVTEFETTMQPTALHKHSLNACIIAEIIASK